MLEPIESRLNTLLKKLGPTEIRKLSRQVALETRTANRARIEANIQPDGSAMTARKKARKIKQKRITIKAKNNANKMFPKLAQANTLKFKATADEASIFFSRNRRGGKRASANTIANRHQFGLAAKNLPVRVLLGISVDDFKHIERRIVEYLAK